MINAVRPRRVSVVASLLPVLIAAALQAEPVAFIEKIEGAGKVEKPSGPPKLLELERAGKLTVGALADAKALPNRFWTLRYNLQQKKLDISGWTAGTVAAKVVEGEKAHDTAEQALKLALGPVATLPPDRVPPQTRAAIQATQDALKESAEYLRELRALHAFMAGRSYLKWEPVGVKTMIAPGDSLRVGPGTEAVVRYAGGSILRAKADSLVTVRPIRLRETPTSEVMARLWKGLCNFYCPPKAAAARELEVATERAVVGIKGTQFSVAHTAAATTVTVTEGTVEATDLATGETVTLSAGQTMTFGGSGAATIAAPEPTPAPEPPAVPEGWARKTLGEVSFSVPSEWKLMPDSQGEKGEGGWYAGSPDAPDAAFGVLRDPEMENIAGDFDDLQVEEAVFAGQAATRYTGGVDGEGRAMILLLKQPGADGRTIALVAASVADKWDAFQPTLTKILSTVRIAAAAPVPEAPGPSAPASATAAPAAVAAPAVPGGWARRTVASISFDLPADWRGEPSETDKTGLVAPDGNTWYPGGPPMREANVQVEIGKPEDTADFEQEDWVQKTAVTVGGLPVTRYEAVLKEGGREDHYIFIVNKRPDAAGRAITLQLLYREQFRQKYAPLMEQVISSIRWEGSPAAAKPPAPPAALTPAPAPAPAPPVAVPPPAPAPAVPEGWGRRTVGDLSLDVPADWHGHPTDADPTGKVAPKAHAWMAGDDLAKPEAMVQIDLTEGIELDNEEARKVTTSKKDVFFGGRPATRYDMAADARGVPMQGVFIRLKQPEASGKPITFQSMYRAALAEKYAPIIERVIASVRFAGAQLPRSPSVDFPPPGAPPAGANAAVTGQGAAPPPAEGLLDAVRKEAARAAALLDALRRAAERTGGLSIVEEEGLLVSSGEWTIEGIPLTSKTTVRGGVAEQDRVTAVLPAPSGAKMTVVVEDFVLARPQPAQSVGLATHIASLLKARGFTVATKFADDGATCEATLTRKPAPAPAAPLKEEVLFSNNNIHGVGNQPTAATTFTLKGHALVTYVMTYHWNGGRGQTPGTVALKHANGTVYGPWAAAGRAGQGGANNAYWECRPNVVLPAGTYTVIDSDPATWARNAQSAGRGMVEIKGAYR